MKADISIKNIGVKMLSKHCNSSEAVPAAKDRWKIKRSLIIRAPGKDMMPVLNTIDGQETSVRQDTLVESPTFDKIKGFLKLAISIATPFKDII